MPARTDWQSNETVMPSDMNTLGTIINQLEAQVAKLSPLESPIFTGTPKVPSKTRAATTDGTLIATEAQVALKANLASPVLTGTPVAPTPAVGDSSTRLATTGFVFSSINTEIKFGGSSLWNLVSSFSSLVSGNFRATLTLHIAQLRALLDSKFYRGGILSVQIGGQDTDIDTVVWETLVDAYPNSESTNLNLAQAFTLLHFVEGSEHTFELWFRNNPSYDTWTAKVINDKSPQLPYYQSGWTSANNVSQAELPTGASSSVVSFYPGT
jgi:hypothetical protein